MKHALSWLAELPEAVIPVAFVLVIAYAAWQQGFWPAFYLAWLFAAVVATEIITDVHTEDCEECPHDA